MWIFGDVKENIVTQHSKDTASGILNLGKATVSWRLSVDVNTLPEEVRASGKGTYRILNIDGESFEFSEDLQNFTQNLTSKFWLEMDSH